MGRVGFGPGVYVVWRGGRGCGRGEIWMSEFDCGFYDCEVVVDSRPILCVGGMVGICNFGFLIDVVGLVWDGEVRVSL